MTVLDEIVEGVRKDLAGRKARHPFGEIRDRAASRGECRRFTPQTAVRVPGIVAEIKRASPSKGWIRKDLDAADTARKYVAAGACAVSVLTEERRFGGNLADLEAVSRVTGSVPVLRKDFVLDEYMIAESRAFGADLVLLMVSVLGESIGPMIRAAETFGLTPLVEIHDEDELETALACGARVIGINNRNLRTLEVSLATAERLLPRIPAGVVRIVESGVTHPEEIRRLHAMGADAFLVGEALVRSCDPFAALKGLLETA